MISSSIIYLRPAINSLASQAPVVGCALVSGNLDHRAGSEQKQGKLADVNPVIRRLGVTAEVRPRDYAVW